MLLLLLQPVMERSHYEVVENIQSCLLPVFITCSGAAAQQEGFQPRLCCNIWSKLTHNMDPAPLGRERDDKLEFFLFAGFVKLKNL